MIIEIQNQSFAFKPFAYGRRGLPACRRQGVGFKKQIT